MKFDISDMEPKGLITNMVISDELLDAQNNGLGYQVNCLMLIEPEVINEIWTEATLNEINLNTPQDESTNKCNNANRRV